MQESDDETLSREFLSCHPSLTQQQWNDRNDMNSRHDSKSRLDMDHQSLHQQQEQEEEEEEYSNESLYYNKTFQHLHRVPFQFMFLILFSIFNHSSAFTLTRNSCTTTTHYTSTTISSSSSTSLFVKQKEKEATLIQPVQPLQTSSKEKRLSVEKAWEQAKLLSKMEEQDFDSSSSSGMTATPYLDLFQASVQNEEETTTSYDINSRPRGRPESVPGAMSRTTLLNLNEVETRLAKETSTTTTKKRGRGRPRKNPVTEIDEITSIAAKKDDSTEEEQETTPKRKSRVKILPKSRKLKESELEGETTGMMPLGGVNEPPNLQKYYRTTLLTQEEEYRLGMKIQFLIQCEAVHEGLYNEFGRLPTITEWANACGFVDSEETIVDKELERQIRPINSEAWEEGQDPNMFVGNGLVNDSGPGRGRGRAKKAPPTFLKDYYDDSDIKFSDKKVKKKDQTPMNRGTPSDFVEIMLTSKEAKQKMVQCNMRLVVSISKRYKHVGVNVADLVQEGSIGLTRAAEKFDPKKGFKFSTYASWWIQQAVFRSIAYHSRTIRLPVHVHNLLNRVRRVRAELKRVYGRTPTNEEMAAELDMSVEKFVKMLRLTRQAISLDMAKYQNNPKDIGQESETSLGDTIDATEVIKDENSPIQNVDRTLFRDDLQEMLMILGEDERRVICARYGINDGLTRTVTTVAAQLGQTKSWVRSQECRALRKLRRPWYEKRLWEHQNSLRG
ncbi:hypothetical protein CTEN210_06759 [Chaetoceros tenuissimus]|uniref:RNA polymerase sigma-70 domain-containing protein n=1 Tax=Chaetoceros tenuissimus TaxID=426638 RepID=A0AAD3H518_9STRA|nr:hypothetical protein CTEN210_06759 [Chaetoceros tenuissimus]